MSTQESVIFDVVKKGLVYTLSHNNNELCEEQFFSDNEARTYFEAYVSDWARAKLNFLGEEE